MLYCSPEQPCRQSISALLQIYPVPHIINIGLLSHRFKVSTGAVHDLALKTAQCRVEVLQSWYLRTVVLWYCGTVVLWYCGTVPTYEGFIHHTFFM